jgi:hypothetical protein
MLITGRMAACETGGGGEYRGVLAALAAVALVPGASKGSSKVVGSELEPVSLPALRELDKALRPLPKLAYTELVCLVCNSVTSNLT